MNKCSVGLYLHEDCSHHTVSKQKLLMLFSEFGDKEKELLMLRTNCQNIENVCYQHRCKFLTTFEDRQRICYDPFKKHKRNVSKGLKVVSVSFSKKYQTAVKLLPGTKLCITCRKLVVSAARNSDSVSDSDYEPGAPSQIIEKLNESCKLIGSSPVKVTKRKQEERCAYLRNKAQRLSATFTEIASKAFHIEASVNRPTASVSNIQCNDCSHLMDRLRVKFETSEINEKLQILTLVPQSWSIKQTVNFFDTTEYLAKKARNVLENYGVLGSVDKRRGHRLSEDVVTKVKEFYYDDEISRISSNTKDCVSVPSEHGKRELKTKRLILHNLKDVYLFFKEQNPNDKIGFTKFCELRPKECVTVNSRGIHSVCVCTYHQNVKLMMQSIHLNTPYQDLLHKLVCDLQSEECMLHRCPNCPDVSVIREYLMQLEIMETKDIIVFKQWIHTDRESLETLTKSTDDFVDLLVDKLVVLTKHHFTAKSQSQYLKQIKNNIDKNSCLIIADFAENYTCIVQDAAQGFHWHNIQVTLHPFVVYYFDVSEDVLKSKSFCFISDCLKHDTTAFFTFQKSLLQHLKRELLHLKHIIYFSDGSAAQYKNYKNLINLCFHHDDYGLTAEWNFFATSHGKNACDGVGGTIKRLATRASLQRTVDRQILNSKDLFKFASENIKGIDVIYTSVVEIEHNEEFLAGRYANATTIPGTRENHYFRPIDKKTLMVKRVSISEKSFIAVVAGKKHTEVMNILPEKYFAVKYEQKWWVGKILEVSDLERDAKIQFMHPCGPSTSFHWPPTDDCCWVPYDNFIKEVPVPASSSSGRTYSLQDDDQKAIEKLAHYTRK